MEIWKRIFIKNAFVTNTNEMQKRFVYSLKYNKIPNRLYKYCRFDENSCSINNLLNDTIWLSHPEKFNDPYDCFLSFSNIKFLNMIIRSDNIKFLDSFEMKGIVFSDNEKKQIKKAPNPYKKMCEIIIRHGIQKNEKPINEKLLHFIAYDIDDEEIYENVNSIFKNIHKNNTVISCFSELYNSILMWSHYARNHTGFCLEYDFRSLGIYNEININLFPVIYQKKLININKYLSKTLDRFNYKSFVLAGITKSIEWKYEKEWRLIFPLKKEESGYSVPKPSKIIAGSKINDKNKSILMNIANKKNIDIYQAKVDENDFLIKFKKENI
jgi:hypothetical protein